MENSTSTAALYYIVVVTLSLVLCSVLIATIKWPPLAEIPLVICIFVQAIALFKYLFDAWANNKEEFFVEIISSAKKSFASLNVQDDEVNSWEKKKAS